VSIHVALLVALLMSIASFESIGRMDGDSVRLREAVTIQDGQDEVLLSQVAVLNGPMAEAVGGVVVYTLDSSRRITHRLRIDVVRKAIADSGANLGLLAVSGSQCLLRPALRKEDAVPVEERTPVVVDDLAGMVRASDYFDLTTIRGLVARNVALVQFARETGTIMLRFDARDDEILDRSAADREYEIRPLASPDTARIPNEIIVYNGQHVERTLRVSVDVAVEREVVVATRTISGGRTIEAEDVALVKQMIDPHPISPVAALETVVGKDARGRLAKGQIIRAHDFDEPVARKRGDRVTLRARSGSFVFRMPGQLLEDARPGQMVRLRRLTDRLEVTGRLEADGEFNISVSDSSFPEDRQ
jgi:flagella basal body P-ring formation protein FlgA